jgi:proton-dependent oligopeptide transporter, POT family
MNVAKKHPKGLYVLFFTEMWERFSYYGMRALLVLYLTSKMINGGFGESRQDALELYAIFTGLIYLTPLLGGFLADKILGQRKAIYIGAFLIALGQFVIAASEFGDPGSRMFLLHNGLGILILGNGFFKPNISTVVGKLYTENDPRKDSAFTIFYMGINLGAFLSPLIAGTLGETVGWAYGFASAGLGMVIGTLWFFIESKHIGTAGLPPHRVFDTEKEHQLTPKDRLDIFTYVAGSAVLVFGFLKLWQLISPATWSVIFKVLAIIGILALIGVIAKNTKGKEAWSKLSVILILCFFNVFFWSGFEQAGGTFNLFAAENTNRMTFLGEIPASVFQSINALFIIILAPVMSGLWTWLSVRGKDPRTPVKFGIALLTLGAGFILMSAANGYAAGGHLVSPMWLIGVYFFHTIGELSLSPIGLSMISKLSPQNIVSVMMGVWFASVALAQYMAGMLESILHNYLPNMPLFHFLTLSSLCAGIVLLALSPFLNKMMKGIH